MLAPAFLNIPCRRHVRLRLIDRQDPAKSVAFANFAYRK